MISDKFENVFKNIERSPIEIKQEKIVTEVEEVKRVVDVERVKQGKLVLGFMTCYDASENK